MIYRYLLFIVLLFKSFISYTQEKAIPEIPEPLLFDLVRGLGAEKGELEINTLVDIPLNDTSNRPVEWAPEIEYALFDGFAVEFELPFEDGTLEAYKFAVQYTIGSSENNKFIHGVQVIAEIFRLESITELNFLYLPAYRFNEVWSAMGLFGLMYEVGSDAAADQTTILLNASVFADLNEHMVLGLELNNTDPTFQKRDNNQMDLIVLPQFHYEFDCGFSFQVGFGPKFISGTTDYSGIVRVIQTF